MKCCSRCGEIKPYVHFRPCPQNKDGYLGRCRLCVKDEAKLYRQRVGVEKKAEAMRRYRLTHPDRITEQRQRYRREFPERKRANNTIWKAIKRGAVVRPSACQWCGAIGRIEASHSDYSKPYDVLWLCVRCHRKRDKSVA